MTNTITTLPPYEITLERIGTRTWCSMCDQQQGKYEPHGTFDGHDVCMDCLGLGEQALSEACAGQADNARRRATVLGTDPAFAEEIPGLIGEAERLERYVARGWAFPPSEAISAFHGHEEWLFWSRSEGFLPL